MAVAPQSRPRPSGGRLFIIVGAVLALLAFGLVLLVGRTGGSGGGGATTKVVVAARQIPLRTQLTKDDLVVQDYPTAAIPATVKPYLKPDDIVKGGLVAEININQGQLITQNMLAQQGDLIVGATAAYLPIPKGYVALTIPAGGEINGVAGFIQAGDYVSLIATVQLAQIPTGAPPAPNQPTSATRTVFQNLQILRLGPANTTVQQAGSTGSGGSGAASGQAGGLTSSMTVVVTPCDAEYLTWLTTNAQIKYELESFHDYQPSGTVVNPDPSCPNVLATHGVTAKQVDTRFKFTAVANG